MEIPGFDLAATIYSGQLFRFWPHEGGFVIGQRNHVFFVRQTGDFLEYKGCTKAFLTSFFRLGDDVNSIVEQYSTDHRIQPAMLCCKGLRLMNQDPWECLIGFLCSSASNIKKIQHNMMCLSKTFGTCAVIQNKTIHTFPRPGSLHDLQGIHEAGTGYRASFIHQANTRVTDSWLCTLKQLPFEEARNELINLPGVGGKIADCVLLFSLGFTQAFPVDVWIERAMHEQYPYTRRLSHTRLEEYCRKRFGPNGGYAQQYLYHWRRNI